MASKPPTTFFEVNTYGAQCTAMLIFLQYSSSMHHGEAMCSKNSRVLLSRFSLPLLRTWQHQQGVVHDVATAKAACWLVSKGR